MEQDFQQLDLDLDCGFELGFGMKGLQKSNQLHHC